MYVVALEVVPSLDLSYCTSVVCCNPSEIVSALDTIDDSFTVSTVLDLLEGCRVEVLIHLVTVDRVFLLDEGICVVVWQTENVLAACSWDDVVTIL